MKKILILGVNGFIGSHLLAKLLTRDDVYVTGWDLTSHKISAYLNHPRFTFFRGDIRQETEALQQAITAADTVLPLVAIANPAQYVSDPLGVYELDFEANIPIIRACAAQKKHLVFPSTSEVYGLCPDTVFDEYASPLVLGPVTTPRWIYSCAKQMLDRFILALNQRDPFPFTLFRPFNWFGPGLDEMGAHVERRCRVVTQFINQILRGEALTVVDGGQQQRAFTYIDDGIDGLYRIVMNENNAALGGIFNIGNPDGVCSIRELAEMTLAAAQAWPQLRDRCPGLAEASGQAVYGVGYADIAARVPSIAQATEKLGFSPRITVQEGVARTVAYAATQHASAPVCA